MTYEDLPKLFDPCEYSVEEQDVQNRSDRLHDHALAYAQKVWQAMPLGNREMAVKAVQACLHGQVNAVAKEAGCKVLPYRMAKPQPRGSGA